jgi:glycogen(starch) synthase
VAKRRGLPLLYEIRAFWEDAAVGNGTGREGSARYRLTRRLETWAARRADSVAVICEGLRRDLVARGIAAEKIIVAPNGVDMSLFGNPLAPDLALARRLGLKDADVVGFIGSFYDYEGLDDLVAAMPLLLAKRPNAHLLLVGGGPMEESALQAQAEASPARERIHFVGRVPHHEVDRYYGLIDILAYPRKAMRLTELVTPLKPSGSDGAAQAGRRVQRRRPSRADRGRSDRHPVPGRRSGRLWPGRSTPCSPTAPTGRAAATSPAASSSAIVTGRQIFPDTCRPTES